MGPGCQQLLVSLVRSGNFPCRQYYYYVCMYNADRLLTHVGIRNQLVRGGGLQRAWLCAQRRSIEFWPQPSQLMESGVRRPQPMASPRCMMAGQKNRVSRPMAPGGTGVDPEPRCWDEPKNPGPWPLARLAARFATCLFRTAPKPAEGSSGAARRDFRSSGQPCGIDVTLISSEQQQASVIISQISGGCRGLSRFAIAMFLETVVNKRACVAEPQQPGGQPARRVPKSVPALLSKLIGLCKPHNTTILHHSPLPSRSCRVKVACLSDIDCTSRGTGLPSG